MPNPLKLEGKRFGRLTVIKRSGSKRGRTYWECLCDCGKKTYVVGSKLTNGNTVSCGCKHLEDISVGKIKDLTNQRFGSLVVVKQVGKKQCGSRQTTPIWLCKCDCGSYCEKTSRALLQDKTISCGCRKYEHVNRTHNLSKHPLYRIYHGFIGRCYNTKEKCYKNYGGRGITVCDEWLGENGFINFYNWAITNGWNNEKMPSGMPIWTIDRIDNNKGYSPDNCRWATYSQQRLNQRTRKQVKEDNEIWKKKQNQLQLKTQLMNY